LLPKGLLQGPSEICANHLNGRRHLRRFAKGPPIIALFSPFQKRAAVSDLYIVLNVLFDSLMYQVWYLQCWMLLGAYLSFFSNQASLMVMVRFAKKNGKSLNVLYGTYSPTCHYILRFGCYRPR
jgi:hypothetical protein